MAHDSTNGSCPRNADDRNTTCSCDDPLQYGGSGRREAEAERILSTAGFDPTGFSWKHHARTLEDLNKYIGATFDGPGWYHDGDHWMCVCPCYGPGGNAGYKIIVYDDFDPRAALAAMAALPEKEWKDNLRK